MKMITKGAKSLVQMIPEVAKVEAQLGMQIDEDSDDTLNSLKDKLEKKSKMAARKWVWTSRF